MFQMNNVDQLAIAVYNLNEAIKLYVDNYGFKLDCIRDTAGKTTGMRSAVLFSGEFSIVLLKSTAKGSQIERYLEKYGPGVQHVAFKVHNIEETYQRLSDQGVKFSTSIIEAPNLKQVFTERDPNTGMMHEYVERTENSGFNFDENNINQLFHDLERSDNF